MKKMSVEEIRRSLLDFHSKRGYKIFDSFPLVGDDPTVMLTNATITPFKDWFLNSDTDLCNFALIQRCFRAGGSSSMNELGHNPNLHILFEMFGTGMFDVNHVTATKHLFDMLDSIGIDKNKLFFTIPPEEDFQKGLESNGIPSHKIHVIENNEIFWCNWQFGKNGLTGRGLTAIYASEDDNPQTITCLTDEDRGFVEFLNLIHVYGQQNKDGSISPIPNPGFEIGMGVERVATILQNCDGYQIDTINPLVDMIITYFANKNCSIDTVTARACTEFLRGICALLYEGLLPSNKGAGYVLRKIIRRFTEHVWLIEGKSVFPEKLVKEFIKLMESYESSMKISESTVINNLREEHVLFEQVLERGIKIMQKNPDMDEGILLDTYGLSPNLVQFIKKGERQ